MNNTIKEEQIEELNISFHNMLRHLARNHYFTFQNETLDFAPLEIGIVAMVYKKPDIILKEIIEIMKIPSSTLTNIITYC